MHLFRKCLDYFQPVYFYPIHPCIHPWQQGFHSCQQRVQPALPPAQYAPSPKAKG